MWVIYLIIFLSVCQLADYIVIISEKKSFLKLLFFFATLIVIAMFFVFTFNGHYKKVTKPPTFVPVEEQLYRVK